MISVTTIKGGPRQKPSQEIVVTRTLWIWGEDAFCCLFSTFQLQKYSVSLKFDQFDPFSQMTWDVWLMPVNANLWRLNLWTNSNNLSSVRSLMQSILKILFFFVGSAGRLGQIFWKAKMQILILLFSWGWAVTFLGDVLPVMKRCLCVDILTNRPNHSIRSDAWY